LAGGSWKGEKRGEQTGEKPPNSSPNPKKREIGSLTIELGDPNECSDPEIENTLR